MKYHEVLKTPYAWKVVLNHPSCSKVEHATEFPSYEGAKERAEQLEAMLTECKGCDIPPGSTVVGWSRLFTFGKREYKAGKLAFHLHSGEGWTQRDAFPIRTDRTYLIYPNGQLGQRGRGFGRGKQKKQGVV